MVFIVLMDSRFFRVENVKSSVIFTQLRGVYVFSFFCNMGYRVKIWMVNVIMMKVCRDRGRREVRQIEVKMVMFKDSVLEIMVVLVSQSKKMRWFNSMKIDMVQMVLVLIDFVRVFSIGEKLYVKVMKIKVFFKLVQRVRLFFFRFLFLLMRLNKIQLISEEVRLVLKS